MNGSITNPRQWEPVGPRITCGSFCRSATHLLQVAQQFLVAANPRYQRTPADTFCNIFLADVLGALGCPPPRLQLVKEGEALKWQELNANRTVEWFLTAGPSFGWVEIPAQAAASRAGLGFPTVATWKNPNPAQSGHVALVLPPRINEVRIAQAGDKNYFDVPVATGFGNYAVRYFTHD